MSALVGWATTTWVAPAASLRFFKLSCEKLEMGAGPCSTQTFLLVEISQQTTQPSFRVAHVDVSKRMSTLSAPLSSGSAVTSSWLAVFRFSLNAKVGSATVILIGMIVALGTVAVRVHLSDPLTISGTHKAPNGAAGGGGGHTPLSAGEY